ncbi:hypothetical protein [Dokdonella sp.]|uniref:hypothetical protein n=1 Tax=Dokdonella sp. TaxID=2291710 RepID=UPI003526D490
MVKKIPGVVVVAALFGSHFPVFATEATSDGFPPAQNVSYYHAPGPDLASDGSAAPSGGTQYLFLAGSAFTPRTSSQTVSYPGGGCSFSDNALTTSLELPEGATVQGVRLYYYNNGLPSSVGLFLTAYTGAGGTSDLLTGSSSEDTGYASEYFAASTPLSIDYAGQSYVLTATMNSGQRLCGMRVFYSP